MTSEQVHAVIEKAIELEDFESPISIAYCEALPKRIVKALGKSSSVEVFHRNTELFVNASVGDARSSVTVPLT